MGLQSLEEMMQTGYMDNTELHKLFHRPVLSHSLFWRRSSCITIDKGMGSNAEHWSRAVSILSTLLLCSALLKIHHTVPE